MAEGMGRPAELRKDRESKMNEADWPPSGKWDAWVMGSEGNGRWNLCHGRGVATKMAQVCWSWEYSARWEVDSQWGMVDDIQEVIWSEGIQHPWWGWFCWSCQGGDGAWEDSQIDSEIWMRQDSFTHKISTELVIMPQSQCILLGCHQTEAWWITHH